ncbi:hypothetical protein Y032_0213g2267 [Ancylostoma ceylanicum]|uniref:Uncharacterized protein n=1 Tax=Ancylostoma ceylanicum TaxID=53326 RepID=A0A016SJI9_9BILA|nr:hypothetical protein Y032_0213g2267 [Ancylostoma ceylanicum]
MDATANSDSTWTTAPCLNMESNCTFKLSCSSAFFRVENYITMLASTCHRDCERHYTGGSCTFLQSGVG